MEGKGGRLLSKSKKGHKYPGGRIRGHKLDEDYKPNALFIFGSMPSHQIL